MSLSSCSASRSCSYDTAFVVIVTGEAHHVTTGPLDRHTHSLCPGATLGGLGAEVARAIAKHANLVVVAGRSADKWSPPLYPSHGQADEPDDRLQKTIDAIKAELPAANIRPLILDLASLAAVRVAAAEVQSWPESFHVRPYAPLPLL